MFNAKRVKSKEKRRQGAFVPMRIVPGKPVCKADDTGILTGSPAELLKTGHI